MNIFDPVKPIDYIREMYYESDKRFLSSVDSDYDLYDMKYGDKAIDENLAQKLSRKYGRSVQSWLNLQELYDKNVKEKEMTNVFKNEVLTVEINSGVNLVDAVNACIEKYAKNGSSVSFKYRGETVLVKPDSTLSGVVEIFISNLINKNFLTPRTPRQPPTNPWTQPNIFQQITSGGNSHYPSGTITC